MKGRGFLNENERATLHAICDTLVPMLDPPPGTTDPAEIAYWRRSASDLDVAAAVEETFWLETTPEEQRQIRLALRLLENRAAMALLTGRAQPFSRRVRRGRESVLLRWARGPLPPLRRAFLAFKRLACFHFYAHPAADGANPNATLLGYPGVELPPPGPPANPAHPLMPRHIFRDAVLDADVCVIGSGAGGGVAAALWAAAGRRVIVLEAGGWYTEADFDAREEAGWERLYLRRGALVTADGLMLVLAGRTLGGGTTVNWSTCFRPPETLLREWAAQTGFPELTGPELQASYDVVERRLNVQVDDRPFNGNNRVLWDGATARGCHVARNPRNMAGPQGDCGLCHFGCRLGEKQGTMRTYLQDAFDAGAQIVPDCHAERVLIEGGKVVGVAASVHRPVEERDPSAPTYRLTVRAPVVVVAAGAINSPAILLRSGLRHPQIGRNLYLHPATGIIGRFDTPMDAWHGPIQAAYSNALVDLTGDGYGLRFEAVPLYPGFAGITLPWTGARAFRATMRTLANSTALLILTRDRLPGRVVLDSQGGAQMVYQPGAESHRLLVRGCQEGARLVLAAGAREALTLHTTPIRLRPGDDPARFDARVKAAGAAPDRMLVGSAHQMGTCRMGSDPAQSVTDAQGAVHGVSGLYVADTSLFPSASGVNPMITAMGLVHWTVSRAIEKGR